MEGKKKGISRRKKLTKKQIIVLKQGWKQFLQDENTFYKLLIATEKWMQKETGIEDLEFFCCDGDFVGIGNVSRTVKLVTKEYLEK